MHRSGRIFLAAVAIALLTGCQSVTPSTSSLATGDSAVLHGWPPMAADPFLTAEARRLCLPDLDVKADIPVALQDRRGPDRATVVFADDATVAYCTVIRTPQGTVPDGGSAMQPRWPKGTGMVTTPAGLTINDATMAVKETDWGNLTGQLPPGAVAIRAEIGGRGVDGVVGNGIYSLSWQGAVLPKIVVAMDAAGREIARIDAALMAKIWVHTCPPGALGCPPPP
jgi:hypothetical protein